MFAYEARLRYNSVRVKYNTKKRTINKGSEQEYLTELIAYASIPDSVTFIAILEKELELLKRLSMEYEADIKKLLD